MCLHACTCLILCFYAEVFHLFCLHFSTAAGFYLRRDDPESLGNQITSIQNKARELEEAGAEVPTRIRFMLEVLMAVRNNNVRRVPGADVERTDRLRRVAGTCVRGKEHCSWSTFLVCNCGSDSIFR